MKPLTQPPKRPMTVQALHDLQTRQLIHLLQEMGRHYRKGPNGKPEQVEGPLEILLRFRYKERRMEVFEAVNREMDKS